MSLDREASKVPLYRAFGFRVRTCRAHSFVGLHCKSRWCREHVDLGHLADEPYAARTGGRARCPELWHTLRQYRAKRPLVYDHLRCFMEFLLDVR